LIASRPHTFPSEVQEFGISQSSQFLSVMITPQYQPAEPSSNASLPYDIVNLNQTLVAAELLVLVQTHPSRSSCSW
jgi:hypothetical protein